MKHAVRIALVLMLSGMVGSTSAQLEPLQYNNRNLVVDLGVGLWAWPLPMDFDGDGDYDLVVNCPDKPSNGVYFFENTTGDTAKTAMPVFKAGRRISRGLQNVQASYVDDAVQILTPGKSYPKFLRSGLDEPKEIPLTEKIHPGKTRANMWRLVDFDGDGLTDIVAGVGYWGDYGWDDAYNSTGEWTNGPLRGFVYVARNVGEPDVPKYSKPVKVIAGTGPAEVFGWPSPNFADFDADGDLDLLCGEFLDGFTYFENRGSRTKPVYAAGRRLRTANRQRLRMDLQMITPTAFDWDKDGDWDLIVGDEDGRVAWIENTGEFSEDRLPLFLEPRYFQQEASSLKFGALSTPFGFDWDGDGDEDIISGNTAGYIGYFENLSGKGVEHPRWNAPKRLKAGGKTIRIQAGPNGSIQGPAEAKWGYTTQTVADWDSDGLPDLLVNSIWGRIIWYRNIGSRTEPRLAAAQPVEVEWEKPGQPHLAYGWLQPEGQGILTQWRTTPVAIDWNRDGLTDLVLLDHEGFLALFERVRKEGQLVLQPPRRLFCDENGHPLQLNARKAGGSGRRKLCLTDWDGDGAIDILVNSENASLLRQVGVQEEWLFKDMGLLHPKKISGHTTSPAVVDFDGNNIPDLLAGAEDGRFYYLKNPR